ncbi:hypothetical protein MN608_08029 [Microdochium nivale]|nr:hypothetical protein MN608_08029 [Microdochium nivale]
MSVADSYRHLNDSVISRPPISAGVGMGRRLCPRFRPAADTCLPHVDDLTSPVTRPSRAVPALHLRAAARNREAKPTGQLHRIAMA